MPLSRRALVGLALTVPVLAACGTTEAPRTAAPANTNTAAATAPATAPAASGPITVTDSRGQEITLDAPATRVVTLEWGPTEDVLALGVTPVAAADPKGFAGWVSSETLPADTIDVGLRTEPSLESIAKAEPDLILGVNGSIPEQAIAQAEKIAPVVLLKGADAMRPLDNMRDNVRATGRLLGKDAEAEQLLTDFDAKLDEAKGKLAGSAPFIFTYINTTGGSVDLRMHSERSLPGAVAKELGLTNAWAEPGDDAWGIGSMDLEGLTALPADTRVLYWANASSDPMADLAGNALWAGLPFVQNDQVKPVADQVWVYGGPSSLTQWVDELVTNLG